jgi:hypothetical protein
MADGINDVVAALSGQSATPRGEVQWAADCGLSEAAAPLATAPVEVSIDTSASTLSAITPKIRAVIKIAATIANIRMVFMGFPRVSITIDVACNLGTAR